MIREEVGRNMVSTCKMCRLLISRSTSHFRFSMVFHFHSFLDDFLFDSYFNGLSTSIYFFLFAYSNFFFAHVHCIPVPSSAWSDSSTYILSVEYLPTIHSKVLMMSEDGHYKLQEVEFYVLHYVEVLELEFFIQLGTRVCN